jgi:arginine deiminase
MPAVRITSEIGSLETVLVHTPGKELEAVTPGTRADFLYNDLLGLEFAAKEHTRFKAVLQRFAKVLEIEDLLVEVLKKPAAREFFTTKTMDVVPSEPLAKQLAELSAKELVQMAIRGFEEAPGPIATALQEESFVLPPLPNLFFPRDIGAVIGDHAVVGSMRYGVRWTEELLIKTLFSYHDEVANAGVLYDGSEERRYNYTLEGGDVHVLRDDLVLLGFSERSSPSALDQLSDVLFKQTRVTDVIVAVMPRERTAIHLDMVFTQIDKDLCVVHPRAFIGPERLTILHRRKGQSTVRQMSDLFAAVKKAGMPLLPVLAGGGRRLDQDREQWASGCNFLAVRPGVAISYARNAETLAELERAGFRIVAATEFVKSDQPVTGRTVITIPGGELVRGGGGPRCMTLPIRRKDVW